MLSTLFSKMWSSCTGELLSKNALVELFLTLFVTFFVAFLLRRRWTAQKSGIATPPLPPGPRNLPLVGYLPFLREDIHHEFSKLASRYGPIYKLWLGSKLCVVISSPSMVKEVVRDHDAVFANREPTASALACTYGGQDIAFSPYGTQWKRLRKILRNTILDNLYGQRREEVHKSIKKIYEKTNTPVDIGSLTFLTAVNASTSMLCGASRTPAEAAVDTTEIRQAVAELTVLLGKVNVSDLFPSLAWLDLQGISRKTNRVARVLERIFDSAIQRPRNLKAEAEDKDFLQSLLELRDEHGDESTSISKDELKAVLVDILVGGTDSATTTVEWTMAELLKHPEVMNKVLQELTQVVGLNNMVQESDLSQLSYLNAVIKESLRLHPPLPLLIPRLASQTTTISGYKVPKNAMVFLNIRAIQRDPEIWEDPLEFRPERFMSHETRTFDYSGNNFHFLPFGSGRRVCPGLPLADRMLTHMIASFLHSFDWKLPPGTMLDMSDKFGFVLKKLEPLVAIPTPRLSNPELY